MNNPLIFVFGGTGQLGQCLQTVMPLYNLENVRFLDEIEGNILDENALRQLFTAARPDYVINCAAYTAVDQAEDSTEICDQVNRVGAANVARYSEAAGANLLHISTDFVFGGDSPKLLAEEDAALPINVYGLTKLQGEQEIAALTNRYYILRTSWLYSEFANNFTKTMLRLGAERSELNVIADQVGTPTYAIDLAHVLCKIIRSEQRPFGLYHYSNEGVASWYDFAVAIFELGGLEVKVNPIPGTAYPTKAKRPAFSVMDKSKIKEAFGIEIPHWRQSLARCITAIHKQDLSSGA
ncbi:dTDP-4-dehydrorhamnose reductase [Pedobacter yulinensis]|uniref:dTDP-4-dehydrorhamnose reductase n=1 Tax=Pedobacter yulinensis TaxID=2126353 RepID=A0A2T3HNP0_9SPHI|nr:dTDP-4-dehydrorhamnose reductase [Pedobacter yulinensis]PST84064.1 dTDP-4-dehydrorhamnose reductase [Pedobacter yulinensis]